MLKHLFSGILILIALLTAVPVKSLHNCSNLNHSHDSFSIENSHEDCSICEVTLHAADFKIEQFSFSISIITPPYTAISHSVFTDETVECFSNKGPPVA